MFPPTKRTTPGQWTVAVWTLIVMMVGAGAVAFFYSFQAVTAEQAAALRRIFYLSLGLAFLIWIIKKVVAMFLN